MSDIFNPLKKLNASFGVKISLEEEKKKFVTRVEHIIFERIEGERGYPEIFRLLCLLWGKNPNKIFESEYDEFASVQRIPPLRLFSRGDFFKTLKLLTALGSLFRRLKSEQDYLLQDVLLDKDIDGILGMGEIDLGIVWKDGVFFPRGAKILDDALIVESLEWLKRFPEECEDFRRALEHLASENFADVSGCCYRVVEGLARKLLVNDRNLDQNKADLLRKVKLSQEWKALLDSYIKFAHQNGRHASPSRHALGRNEIEAFVYMTGVFSRLIVKAFP